jgi:hypothetical protein
MIGKNQNLNYVMVIAFILNQHYVIMESAMTRKRVDSLKILSFTIIGVVLSLNSQNIMAPVFGQSESLPFEVDNFIEPAKDQSQISNNSFVSNSTTTETSEPAGNCVMPPCPPGHACIQSCP